MNTENYQKYAKQYERRVVGPTSIKFKEDEGWSLWAENGIWITAKTVSTGLGHAYNNGGYEHGIRDCPCGCYMLSSSSAGPVDPFGDCPLENAGKEEAMKTIEQLEADATAMREALIDLSEACEAALDALEPGTNADLGRRLDAAIAKAKKL